MKKKLHDWLTGNRHYAEGVELYRQYGSGTLLSLFESGENSYTRKALSNEITSLVTRHSVPQPDVSTITSPVIGNDREALVAEKGDRYARANHLRAELMRCDSKERRQVIASEIMNHHDRIREIWDVIDHGQPMKPSNRSELERLSPLELSHRRALISNYLVKAKKKRNSALILSHQETLGVIDELLSDAGKKYS